MNSTEIAQKFIQDNNQFIFEGDNFQTFIEQCDTGYINRGIPNSTAYVKKKKSETSITYPGSEVYSVIYSFNEDGIRYTPSLNGNYRPKVAIFFGDSQAFGEGVNDTETLPYYFQENNADFKSYNYAHFGHSIDNMIGWLSTEDFINKFKNKNGEVFYLYRDDTIRKVNRHQENITADLFTETDYTTVIQRFKETTLKLKAISDNLNFTVVLIPLSFSSDKLYDLLIKNNINSINLFSLDLEFYTDIKSRFLDGCHTKYSNQILAKIITQHYSTGFSSKPLFNSSIITKESDLINRVKIESFFMPYMVDFPKDDAGVIISKIKKNYNGKANDEKLIELSEKNHFLKVNLINRLKEKGIIKKEVFNEYLKGEVIIDLPLLKEEPIFNNLPQEYQDTFIKFYTIY